MDDKTLIREAIAAREAAYAPYSGFLVGAALLTKSGKAYRGCNIENIAYSPTNCAERTAFFKAVSEGERNFSAIAVAGWHRGDEARGFAYPCGVCRQVMLEFCDPEAFRVLIAKSEDEFEEMTLAQLLPRAFSQQLLKGE